MDALFEQARALSAAHEDAQAQAAAREAEEHALAVAAAQDRLLDRLVQDAEGAVLEAARQGRQEAELLVFEGGDTFDGEFCYLYLLKGPRARQPGQPGGARVRPLLPRVRERLAPFHVRHDWKLGTVQNAVVVSWRGP